MVQAAAGTKDDADLLAGFAERAAAADHPRDVCVGGDDLALHVAGEYQIAHRRMHLVHRRGIAQLLVGVALGVEVTIVARPRPLPCEGRAGSEG